MRSRICLELSSRKPSWPAFLCERAVGRTYGRKRSDQRGCETPCKEGAVHIWGMSDKTSFGENAEGRLRTTIRARVDRPAPLAGRKHAEEADACARRARADALGQPGPGRQGRARWGHEGDGRCEFAAILGERRLFRVRSGLHAGSGMAAFRRQEL